MYLSVPFSKNSMGKLFVNFRLDFQPNLEERRKTVEIGKHWIRFFEKTSYERYVHQQLRLFIKFLTLSTPQRHVSQLTKGWQL